MTLDIDKRISDTLDSDYPDKYYGHQDIILTEDDLKALKDGKVIYLAVQGEYSIALYKENK